jgi:hypothetical protein
LTIVSDAPNCGVMFMITIDDTGMIIIDDTGMIIIDDTGMIIIYDTS